MISAAEQVGEGRGKPRIAVIEAGTGTGKSFGYLIPGISAAVEKKKKLIISTATVALQHQLWSRDIPAILEANNLTLKVALAKGRSRYACSMKLRNIAATGTGSGQALRMAERYIQGAWSGDLDEWNSTLDAQSRLEVTETGPGCLRRKCPSYEECAAFKARGEAAAADIIVSNHSLTFLSLSSQQGGPIGIKPEESIIVFDEGHHIDTVLKESLSVELNVANLIRWVKQGPAKVSTVFQELGRPRIGEEVSGLPAWDVLAEQLQVISSRAASLPYKAAGDASIHRLKNAVAPEGITAALKKTAAAATIIAVNLDKHAEKEQSKIDSLPVAGSQLKEAIEKLYALAGSAESLSRAIDKDHPKAAWIEKKPSRDGDEFSINQKPLEVSKQLQSLLWDRVYAAILTSATITALGDFDDFARRTGLADRADVMYKQVGSPFDYAAQGEINLLPMKAEPQGKTATEFEEEVIRLLPGQINQTPSALVLFTSRAMMQRALKAMPRNVRESVLSQDDFGKRELIDRHKIAIDSGRRSAIFGLASLAEGLDLPGKYLEHVVITKLQFGSPEDPVFQAHSEYLESLKRNPFIELALTDASIKLVQAVGRLIRTANDIGRVTIMDKRIVTKRYGKQLLSALPPLRVVSTSDPVNLSKFRGPNSQAPIATLAERNSRVEDPSEAVDKPRAFNDPPLLLEDASPSERKRANTSTLGLQPPSIFDPPSIEQARGEHLQNRAVTEIMLPPALI